MREIKPYKVVDIQQLSLRKQQLYMANINTN